VPGGGLSRGFDQRPQSFDQVDALLVGEAGNDRRDLRVAPGEYLVHQTLPLLVEPHDHLTTAGGVGLAREKARRFQFVDRGRRPDVPSHEGWDVIASSGENGDGLAVSRRIAEVHVGLRTRIADELKATVHGGDLKLERYEAPADDPGLLGIASGDPAWRVHGHLTGMLTGGFAALMLQSLHPLAMAGVDQHSDFRSDPASRFISTARFITTTTFGSASAAREAIALVRRIHTRVRGTASDGRPYCADDPELLTWVHVAEVRCFLAGYQTYAPQRLRLTPAECDTYYRQVAPVAEMLGAEKVPCNAQEVERYLARIRPQLHATQAALDSVQFLRGFGRTRRERLVVGLLMNASVGLLPHWARAELGMRRPTAVRTCWDRPVATAAGRAIEWARGPSEIQAAAQRRLGSGPPVGAGEV